METCCSRAASCLLTEALVKSLLLGLCPLQACKSFNSLFCSLDKAYIVGPKGMVLASHVCFLSISGSCMGLDINPTLMFTCQLSKLVKKHLVICHKSGMLDDGAICFLWCEGLCLSSVPMGHTRQFLHLPWVWRLS